MTAPEEVERLRAELGATPPESVAALDPEVVADLATAIRDARRAQAAALAEAFEATLKHVPFPVRGIVRKVLTG